MKTQIRKKIIFKNCAPYTDFISEINNTETDYAKDIDAVKPMYDLIEYSNNIIWSFMAIL